MEAPNIADHFPDVQSVSLGDLNIRVDGQSEPKTGVTHTHGYLAVDLGQGRAQVLALLGREPERVKDRVLKCHLVYPQHGHAKGCETWRYPVWSNQGDELPVEVIFGSIEADLGG